MIHACPCVCVCACVPCYAYNTCTFIFVYAPCLPYNASLFTKPNEFDEMLDWIYGHDRLKEHTSVQSHTHIHTAI